MNAPVPLPNQGGGGDNTWMIAALVACCCSSSIGGGIFAFLRMRKKKVVRKTKRVRRFRRGRRGRGRGRPRRFRRRFRRFRPRFRRFRRRRFRPRRFGRMGRFGRRFRRPRFARFRRRCFAPETEVQLKNGTTRQMKNLELGDVLINGSIVEATMKIKNQSDPYYKIGDIHVTGSHYVKDGNVYKQVRNFSKAEPTNKVDKVVCCLVTNDHKIPVGNFTFWDWEDNLVPNYIQTPTKAMTIRNRLRNTSVVGDK